MISKTLYSSASDDWATPQEIYDKYNKIFGFTLDVCASATNHKCDKYFTKEQDGLIQDWSDERVWCNPPYGRGVEEWVKKCYEHNSLAVMLLPARTDTRWYHSYINANPNVKVFYLKGRLHFGGG